MLNKTLLPALLLLVGIGFLATGETPVALPEAGGTSALDANKFKIDRTHSSLLFRIRHFDSAYFFGRFNKMDGEFLIDDADLGSSFVKIDVDAKSVDGNSRGRNTFLRGADLLAAKEFPKITFASKAIAKKSDDVYEITGDITFRGVTKSVTFEARHTGTATFEKFGVRKGFLAEIPIMRSEFGMKYGIEQKVLGDEVVLIVSLEGARAK